LMGRGRTSEHPAASRTTASTKAHGDDFISAVSAEGDAKLRANVADSPDR
jgi:hypothetical protein